MNSKELTNFVLIPGNDKLASLANLTDEFFIVAPTDRSIDRLKICQRNKQTGAKLIARMYLPSTRQLAEDSEKSLKV